MYIRNNEQDRLYYGLKEYLIESSEDVADLPLTDPLGSCALDMGTGALYFLVSNDGGQYWQMMDGSGGGGGGGGGGGTVTMHNELQGRDSAGCHKMIAITGLVDELAKKYEKPLAGIPKEDLAQAVQNVINTALTSTDPRVAQWSAKYDKPSTGIPKSDLASVVQNSLTKADTSVQKVNTIGPDATGNVALTKANIGLSNVDNTSDVNKPVSTAQKAYVDAETTRAQAAETAEKTRATEAESTLETAIATEKTRAMTAETALDTAITTEKTRAQTEESKKVDKTTTVNGKALSANITLNQTDIGLGNVDNTSDANKPVSTAQRTAIDTCLDDAKAYSDALIAGLGAVMSMKGRQASEAALKALVNVKKGAVYVVADSEGTDFLWVALDDIGATPAPSKWLKLGAASISGVVYVDGDYVPNDVLVSTNADGGTKTVKAPGLKYIGTVNEVAVTTANNGFKFTETKTEDETSGYKSKITLDWDPDVIFIFDAGTSTT